MGWLRKQLLDVIQWTSDGQDDLMVYRFPVDDKEIKNGAQLTVRESQVAIFVNEGQICDVFAPGRYKLTTNNLPVLTSIQSWKYKDKESPFKAEVYFVNTKQFQGQKWGTANPFALRDPEFGVVRIRAFGTYSLRVADPKKFLQEVFGTSEKYKVSAITSYAKSIIVSSFTDFMAEQKMPVLDIPTMYTEIGNGATVKTNDKLDSMGLMVQDVIVENISLPDEVEKAIDTRSSMSALGDMNTYTQYKAANSIETAAANQQGFAGTGMGLGVGLGMGQIMGNAMGQAVNAQQQASSQVLVVCPNCGKKVPEGKFCPECGKQLVTEKVKCIKCGALINAGSKFCPECGSSQTPVETFCPKCGAKLPAGSKFCTECGEKIG